MKLQVAISAIREENVKEIKAGNIGTLLGECDKSTCPAAGSLAEEKMSKRGRNRSHSRGFPILIQKPDDGFSKGTKLSGEKMKENEVFRQAKLSVYVLIGYKQSGQFSTFSINARHAMFKKNQR